MSVERVEGGGAGRMRRPAAGTRPPADRTGRLSMPAATFAALAEAGLFFLPVRLLMVQTVKATDGPFASFLPFVAVFTVGVAGATRYRRARLMPVFVLGAVVAMAILQAALADAKADLAVGVSLFAAVGIGLRIVSLGIHDWRNPVTAAFGWGAVALLVEVALASNVEAGWEPVLPVIVPLFFAGMLVSRALSVRLTGQTSEGAVGAEDPEAGEVEPGAAPPRMGLWLVAGMLGAIALGTGLGYQGGVFVQIGAVVWAGVVWVIVAMALVLAVAATPITLLLRGLHFDLAAGLRRVANNIRRVAPHGKGTPGGPPVQIPWLGRAIGVVAVVLVAFVVWRMIRNRRRPREWDPNRPRPAGWIAIEDAVASAEPPADPRRRRRVDLPGDTVRRWYAELLLLLDGRGLPKPGPATPREYVPSVAAAFPEGSEAFASVTRAYEEVRYAGRRPDRARLRALRADREAAAAVIRKAKRADEPEDEQQTEPGVELGGADDQGSPQQ